MRRLGGGRKYFLIWLLYTHPKRTAGFRVVFSGFISRTIAEYSSLMGVSKSLEDTEKVVAGALLAPSNVRDPTQHAYRVFYAVHERISPTSENGPTSRFIGTILLRSLEGGSLDLSPPLVPAPSTSLTNPFLTIELSYQFLPAAWGKGYAGESLNAVFEACAKNTAVWKPYERVYCRVIVNDGNPASLRVMSKLGVKEKGVYKWTGKIWLAGGWRYEDDLHIFGRWFLGEE